MFVKKALQICHIEDADDSIEGVKGSPRGMPGTCWDQSLQYLSQQPTRTDNWESVLCYVA